MNVAILMDGLADVVEIGYDTNNDGTPDVFDDLWNDDGDGAIEGNELVGYEIVGGDIPSLRFLGNIVIASIGVNLYTITRANGSELGSFVEEGFQVGLRIRTSLGLVGDVFQIVNNGTTPGVTDDVLIVKGLGVVPPTLSAGSHTDARISTLTRSGIWDGQATVQAPEQDMFDTWEGWTLVRQTGGWLADGFLEGQWIEICKGSYDALGVCSGATLRAKIQLIRGTNATFDNELELRYTPDPLDPFGEFQVPIFFDDLSGFTAGFFTVTRIAAVTTFTDTNWYQRQTVKLVADVNFDVPIARDGAKMFPVTTHGFWKLQGPLAVEGGVTGADRSLQLGLKLPGEADGPLFKIGTQPPESKQIDVLNLFNDGSKQNRSGTMTSTTLSGLGLPKDLDFGPVYSSGNPQTFGEPADLPGRHRLRHRAVRRRHVHDERRQEHDRGRQPDARHRQRQPRHPGHDRPRRRSQAHRHHRVHSGQRGHSGDQGEDRPDPARAVRLEGARLPRRPAGPDHRYPGRVDRDRLLRRRPDRHHRQHPDAPRAEGCRRLHPGHDRRRTV